MHTIQNDVLKISVANRGAELKSLFHKPSSTEHLWQAHEAWWGWSAPMLFPVVGRCLNDAIEIDGRHYSMEKHGFARKQEFTCNAIAEDELHFTLIDSPATHEIFLYRFSLKVIFKLVGGTLFNTYEIENKGGEAMLFSIGAHPAFNVPFYANENFEDYSIQFEQQEVLERHHINAEGFFDGRKSVVSVNGNINLHHKLFDDDALIFKTHQSRSLNIVSRNHKQALKVHFHDFPYLGIWQKEGAPYVCIEPWLGCADTFEQPKPFDKKEGILMLESGKLFKASFSIEVS